MQGTAANPQQEVFRKRLPVVIVGMVVFSVYLVGVLASFQWLPPDVDSYMRSRSDANYTRTLRLADARGLIYDRNGETLAANTLDFRIGISPNLVTEPREAATQLARLLGLNELDVFNKIRSKNMWVLLASPVTAQVTQEIQALGIRGVTIESIPRRSYPQGTLAAHVLGFVNLDLQGHYGVEGYYQDQLMAQVRERQVSNIPFEVSQTVWNEDRGRDVILTIDRDIQYLAESTLEAALRETQSDSGTIIIMDPRNGEILALANSPAFDPNAYFNVSDASVLANPAISNQFEPGSVAKILTVAGALDMGIIDRDFTYYDNGMLTMGGIQVQNWDRAAHGHVDVTQILVQSLNIGVATISGNMGPTNFYQMMSKFGVGRLTGVDLAGEAAGTMWVPGDANWSESQLATNSFGQGLAMTPLQLLRSVNAVANGGLMMQPHVVREIREGDKVYVSQPSAIGRPISAETARIVTEMLVATVRDGLDNAVVDGYTIAGKSGTAQIPSPTGYEFGSYIMTFVGYLPADNPQVSVLIKLDRPRSGQWASQVAAPVFQRLVDRLVVLMEIPNDEVRYALAAQGGAVGIGSLPR